MNGPPCDIFCPLYDMFFLRFQISKSLRSKSTYDDILGDTHVLSTRLFWPIHIWLPGCRVIRISRFFRWSSVSSFYMFSILVTSYLTWYLWHWLIVQCNSSNHSLHWGACQWSIVWIDLPLQELRCMYRKGWK